MNIIELVKQTLTEFPRMSEFTGGIHVDFAEPQTDNCGLSPTGDSLIKEDILGNQIRQHNFVLYANNQSINDFDRLSNSTFLLDLAYWLERKASNQPIEVTIDEKAISGKLLKLSSSNGMIFGWQNETLSGPVTYQLQIYAQYSLESEVL